MTKKTFSRNVVVRIEGRQYRIRNEQATVNRLKIQQDYVSLWLYSVHYRIGFRFGVSRVLIACAREPASVATKLRRLPSGASFDRIS